MLRRIRLLLMPDLSTETDVRTGHLNVFLLAPGKLHVSFKSSDEETKDRRDIKGSCKTSQKRTGRTYEEIDR